MPTYAGPAGWRKIASNRIAPRPKTVEVALGADLVEDDGTLIYDYSESEIAGGVAPATTIPKVVSDGTVLADDGNVYDTVQAAENAASDWIFIGVGTFAEAVTVDTAGLLIRGSGRGTLIDGGTDGTALQVNAARVTVKDLDLKTTAGAGNLFDGLDADADEFHGENIRIRDSDNEGFTLGAGGGASAQYSTLYNCHVESCDGTAYSLSDADILVGGLTANESNVGGSLIGGTGYADDALVMGLLTESTKRVKGASYSERIQDLGNVSGTGAGSVSIDLSKASVFEATLTGNTEFTFDNADANNAGSFTLIVSQDGTGGHSITWPSSVEWANGSKPAVSTGANEKDWYGFISPDGGTTWLGVQSAAALA